MPAKSHLKKKYWKKNFRIKWQEEKIPLEKLSKKYNVKHITRKNHYWKNTNGRKLQSKKYHTEKNFNYKKFLPKKLHRKITLKKNLFGKNNIIEHFKIEKYQSLQKKIPLGKNHIENKISREINFPIRNSIAEYSIGWNSTEKIQSVRYSTTKTHSI